MRKETLTERVTPDQIFELKNDALANSTEVKFTLQHFLRCVTLVAISRILSLFSLRIYIMITLILHHPSKNGKTSRAEPWHRQDAYYFWKISGIYIFPLKVTRVTSSNFRLRYIIYEESQHHHCRLYTVIEERVPTNTTRIFQIGVVIYNIGHLSACGTNHMIISHRHRHLFVHIPKTGRTSLNLTLEAGWNLTTLGGVCIYGLPNFSTV